MASRSDIEMIKGLCYDLGINESVTDRILNKSEMTIKLRQAEKIQLNSLLNKITDKIKSNFVTGIDLFQIEILRGYIK